MLKETIASTTLFYDNNETASTIQSELWKEQKEMQDQVCTKC